jgi:biotin carboxyl carrier protein
VRRFNTYLNDRSLILRTGIEVGFDQTTTCYKSRQVDIEISVIVGQTVKENDSLLILEAMKMENSFLST